MQINEIKDLYEKYVNKGLKDEISLFSIFKWYFFKRKRSVYIYKKIKAMKQYKIELKKFPHPRSLKNIENLAKLRESNVGFECAEDLELGYEKII